MRARPVPAEDLRTSALEDRASVPHPQRFPAREFSNAECPCNALRIPPSERPWIHSGRALRPEDFRVGSMV